MRNLLAEKLNHLNDMEQELRIALIEIDLVWENPEANRINIEEKILTLYSYIINLHTLF